MSLEVLTPGFLSLVQDYGRFGQQRYGITHSGPMDEHAFLWANRLLGNDFNAAQLEICMGGFSARFHQETMISVCGAIADVTLNGEFIELSSSYSVKSGDVIKVENFSSGLYVYLAISGGFHVEQQLGSASTVMREKLGGLHKNGERLAFKDSLEYTPCLQAFKTSVPEKFKMAYAEKVTIRFIPNHSINGCSDQAIEDFCSQVFAVSTDINRMGYRLKGHEIKSPAKGIISQGLGLGTIQLPKDGQPIVLMKDRQTIGGYPLLGCVAHLDIARLSQSRPGTKLAFEAVEIDDVEEELRDYMDYFDIRCS